MRDPIELFRLMDGKPRSLDARIAWVAQRQHGVISVRQLLRLGASRDEVEGRARRGALTRVHRGVYAVGHRRADHDSRCMAAWLALGGAAAVSHASALVVLGVLDGNRGPIHIATPARRLKREGIAVHWAADLRTADVERPRGIPTTGLVRSLCDVAAAGSMDMRSAAILRRAFTRGERLGRITPRVAVEALDRSSGRPGAGLVRRMASDLAGEEAPTRSEMERTFLRVSRRAGLPKPRMNVKLLDSKAWHDGEVDAVWPEQRLVIELDSWEFHSDRRAFERDRERDAELAVAGYRVIRITWRRLASDVDAVVAQIRALLDAG